MHYSVIYRYLYRLAYCYDHILQSCFEVVLVPKKKYTTEKGLMLNKR